MNQKIIKAEAEQGNGSPEENRRKGDIPLCVGVAECSWEGPRSSWVEGRATVICSVRLPVHGANIVARNVRITWAAEQMPGTSVNVDEVVEYEKGCHAEEYEDGHLHARFLVHFRNQVRGSHVDRNASRERQSDADGALR